MSDKIRTALGGLCFGTSLLYLTYSVPNSDAPMFPAIAGVFMMGAAFMYLRN